MIQKVSSALASCFLFYSFMWCLIAIASIFSYFYLLAEGKSRVAAMFMLCAIFVLSLVVYNSWLSFLGFLIFEKLCCAFSYYSKVEVRRLFTGKVGKD